jgi:hypothetical protein
MTHHQQVYTAFVNVGHREVYNSNFCVKRDVCCDAVEQHCCVQLLDTGLVLNITTQLRLFHGNMLPCFIADDLRALSDLLPFICLLELY